MPDDSSSTDLIPYQPPKPPTPKRPYIKRNPGGPRVPPADGGIQSNFCRNINCENFGVEPLPQVQQGRTKKGQIRAGDGYVFGMQTNIDPSVDTERMEAEAIVAGDFAISEPSFRRFARFWTTPDYETAKIDDPAGVPSRLSDTGDVRADVVASYDEMAAIADPEAKERAPTTTALPTSCAQVHFEYTVHAHFRLLRRMLGDVGKIRFFMDQDDTLRAGCISTYVEEMRAGRADAFYVKIDKGLNVDQRNRLASQSMAHFKKFKDSIGRPGMSDWWVRVLLLEVEIQSAMEQLSPRDRWVVYPESTQAEPLKAVCWLTDRDGVAVPLRQMAIVFARASMHAIDRYFMQVRRLLMALERPIHTPSNDGRVWRGYSPYDPTRVQKLLDIYRCYYNFVKKGRDHKTPAMRLGLAKGPIRIEDILYFDPTCRAEVAARRRS